MQIPVMVMPKAGGGFVARAGSPFDWTAEGATAAEAVDQLQAEADRHSAGGTRAAAISMPNGAVPDAGLGGCGIVPHGPGSLDLNHPMVQEYMAELKRIRAASSDDRPWEKFAGTWADIPDDVMAEYQRGIEEYRAEIEADPNR